MSAGNPDQKVYVYAVFSPDFQRSQFRSREEQPNTTKSIVRSVPIPD